MKALLMVLVIVFTACSGNGNSKKNSLNSLDSNAANNTLATSVSEILIQRFTQIPSIANNCTALFVTDTANAMQEYVFVTDLKGLAFIKLNNRLMELKLIKQ